MAENKVSDIIKTSLSSVKEIIDIDTVIGKPIKCDNGTEIIPVMKVSVGLASGGLDHFANNLPKSEKDALKERSLSFAGGGGTGLSVTPVGFLVLRESGGVEFLSIAAANTASTTVDIIDRAADFIERSPELLQKFKNVFQKDKSEKEETKAAEDK